MGTLLETKLEIPTVNSKIVSRTRLTNSLTESLTKQLTILIAPPGFGKTILLTEWLSTSFPSSARSAWINLDHSDNNPRNFLLYLFTAIDNFSKRSTRNFEQLLSIQDEIPEAEILIPSINHISELPRTQVLILDNFEVIQNEIILNYLQFLIEHQSRNLHLIISSRTRPSLQLSRLRAHDQIKEILKQDLAFTLTEANTFFQDVKEKPIQSDLLLALLNFTEGWPAGLQLLSSSLYEKSSLESFPKRLIPNSQSSFEFLTEQVFNQQSEKTKEFLVKTSTLNEFSAALCDAVLERQDSQEMLDSIYHDNLFIEHADNKNNWYRYTRIFRDFLQKQLENQYSDVITDLHRKSYRWLWQNNYPQKAIFHSQAAGDIEIAAEMMEAMTMQALMRVDLIQLVKLDHQHSKEILAARPYLAICSALLSILLGNINQAEQKLHTIDLIHRQNQVKNTTNKTPEQISWEIAVIQSVIDCLRHCSTENISHLQSLMKASFSKDNYYTGLLCGVVAEAFVILGNTSEADEAFQNDLQFCAKHENKNEYSSALADHAQFQKIQGQLHRAEQNYRTILDHSENFNLGMDILQHAQTGLADIALDRNDILQADDWMQNVIKNLVMTRFSQTSWIRYEWIPLRLARYYLIKENYEEASRFFDFAKRYYFENQHTMAFLTGAMIHTQIRFWQVKGELQNGNFFLIDELKKLDHQNKVRFRIKIAKAHLYLSCEAPEQALIEIREIEPFVRQAKFNEVLIETLILKALALQAICQSHKAYEAIGESLQLAAPESYIRIFIDAGKPLYTFLQQYHQEIKRPYQAQNFPDIIGIQHLQNVLSAFTVSMNLSAKTQEPSSTSINLHTSTKYSPLSQRETEIFHKLISGDSIKEISRDLMISINTVKTHVKRIYQKLDVHSSFDLMMRAKELNLLEKSN